MQCSLKQFCENLECSMEGVVVADSTTIFNSLLHNSQEL